MSADRPSIKIDYHLSLFSGKCFLKNDLEYRGQGMKWNMHSLLSSCIQKQDGSIAEDLIFNYVVVFSKYNQHYWPTKWRLHCKL